MARVLVRSMARMESCPCAHSMSFRMTPSDGCILFSLGDQGFNILDVVIAMQGPVHAELCGGRLDVFLDLFHKLRREHCKFGIQCFRGGQAKFDSPARVEGMAQD